MSTTFHKKISSFDNAFWGITISSVALVDTMPRTKPTLNSLKKYIPTYRLLNIAFQ
jgi:4-aminobutyrate aminotransferase-like enzyme